MNRTLSKATNHPRGAKRIVFALLALAIPVVLVLAVELGLRWVGYGGYGVTFHVAATTADGRRLIAADNQRVDTFFFNNRDLPGQLNPTFFWNPKAPGTLRVIVVGESAIRGFPQPASLISTAFLAEMLRDALPERPIEVINLGVTAVASFPVLEIGTEALSQDPDVLVVQMGNNEFFGAFGVASLNRAGSSPLAIAFQRWGKSLAMVQGAEELIAGLRGPAPAPTQNTSATLMERMMGRNYTGPHDPVRGAAARNIRTHLRELIRRCEKRSVPVVVCITGTNERGMAPLGTSTTDSVPQADKARFDEVLTITPENALARIEDIRWAVGIAPDHARAHWLLATALHERGTFEEARRGFQRAIDLDPMPWRGTTEIHAAMRSGMDGTGAVLADAQASLRDASPGGSIGWETMVDHVHMGVEGQAIVARAIFDAMGQIPSAGIPAGAGEHLATGDAYAERLGATIWDAHGVAYRMYKLLKVPFFEATNPWASKIMEARMGALEQGMTDSERGAVVAWQNPQVSMSYAVPASSLVGDLCIKEQRYDVGERAYRAATRAITPYTYLSLEYTYRWLGCRLRAAGALDEADLRVAREALDRGLVMIASSSTKESAQPLHRYVGSLYTLLDDCAEAVPHLQEGKYAYADMELVQIDAQIVECLAKLGRVADARQIIDYGSARAGPFAPMYRDMTRLLGGTGGTQGPGTEPPKAPGGTN